MFSFTSYSLLQVTAGLLALLGLAVPLAIHLWNRRPGRTVQVGSVRWLAAAANRRLRNLRLEQVGLLLLRAAIVALLAMVVAQPVWHRLQPAAPVRGQVLVAPDLLRPDVLPALRPGLDSLRRRGYVLRLFSPGFRVVSAQAWGSPDSLAKLTTTSALAVPAASRAAVTSSVAPLPDDYWARARQATDSFPDQPLRIVSGGARRHFFGPRPALPAHLTWQTVPLPDSVVWLAGAALSGPDTLRLLIGCSQEEATTFRVVRQVRPRAGEPLAVAGLPGLRYQPAQAARPATVQLPNQPAVEVVAQPLRVLLYADAAHAEAGRYIRAALQATAIGLATPLEIRAVSPEGSFTSTQAPAWLFWLSEKPVPPTWQAQVRRGTQLWQEAVGAGAPLETELNLTGLVTAPPVLISRLDTTAMPAAGTAVWQDGAGRPVLTRQPNGRGAQYQLRTRLNPAWSDLPDSPALPELFLTMLRPAQPNEYATHDLRQLDASQLLGSVVSGKAAAPDSVAPAPAATRSKTAALPVARQPAAATELRAWVALAALVLFGVERWVASRQVQISSISSL